MKPIKNPIIPGSNTDRTGSREILRSALKEIDRRFAGLQSDVLALFGRIPVYSLNDSAMPVAYGMTPQQLEQLSVELQETLARWISEGKDAADFFWWDTYSSQATQSGTAQSVANLSRLSDAYARARSLAQIINSTPYRTRLAISKIKSYEHWAGLAYQTKSDLAQIIGRAIVDGKNPAAVRDEIAAKLDVSKAKAAQYAQTDITDTLRQAKWAEDDEAEKTFGFQVRELWTSALLPTTRTTHAARHGRVYTREQVRDFYDRDGNRYNCHCATTACLIDENGRPILSGKLKATMSAVRDTWERDNKK